MSSVQGYPKSQNMPLTLYAIWRYRKQNRITLAHWFVPLIPLVCPEFFGHRVHIDSKTEQVAVKTARIVKQSRADHFSDFIVRASFSSNTGFNKDRETIHRRHRCTWSPNRVCAATKAKRQCLQTNWILVKDLEQPSKTQTQLIDTASQSFGQSLSYVCIWKVSNSRFKSTIMR